MDFHVFIEILMEWKIVATSLLIMIVLPLVFYIASLDKKKGGGKVIVQSPNKNLKTRSVVKDKKSGAGEEANENDTEDNNQGGEGA